jgi:alpha-beta hydrolase superfamily lysophospholipase
MTPTRTVNFPSSGGAQLYGEWFATPGAPRALAVVVHGYAEHCGRYREVAHALVSAGLAVFTFDQRGHGQASGRRGHINRFTDYLDDLDAAMVRAGALAGDVPRVLVAHSNGSLIALRALADPARRPNVRLAALGSPFLALNLQVPVAKQLAGRIASRIVPTLSLPNELRVEDLTHDPAKQEERRRDTLCHGVATARWFTEASAAQHYVYAHAAAISVPTIWLVGGADPIANPARSREVQKRLRAPSTFHDLTGMKHEVFNEVDRARVFGLMTEFVTRELKVAA